MRRSNQRINRLKSCKECVRFFTLLSNGIGPAGRAKIIRRRQPAKALEILMSHPESEWGGDDKAWEEFLKMCHS